MLLEKSIFCHDYGRGTFVDMPLGTALVLKDITVSYHFCEPYITVPMFYVTVLHKKDLVKLDFDVFLEMINQKHVRILD